MPGVPGRGGRPPKPASQRRGRNKLAVEPTHIDVLERKVPIPRGDAKWHPVAKRWYQSLKNSAQAELYQASDWAVAWLIAESMSRELKPQPVVVGFGDDQHIEMIASAPRAASVTAWLKGMESLLATESARQKARVVLNRPQHPGDAAGGGLAYLEDYRRRIKGSE